MSHHQTKVWVKTCLLIEALILSGQECGEIENSDDSWDWCHAILIEGNLKSQDNLTLQLDSSLYGSSDNIVVPRDLINTFCSMSPGSNHFTNRKIYRRSGSSPRTVSQKGTGNKNDKKQEVIVMANIFSDEEESLPPEDLITLTHLHEPALVYSLRKRFEARRVYTATGAILIAVNPFEEMENLYDEINMKRYFAQGSNMGNQNFEATLPPHVFGTTDNAFRNMKKGLDSHVGSRSKTICDQSILVSGESGAGKTVSCRFIMKYLSALSRSAHNKKKKTLKKPPSLQRPTRKLTKGAPSCRTLRLSQRAKSVEITAVVEQKILESNPILESFGNARTIRNDNSSRFGKFIELQFESTGSLIGAKIKTYLLEKVRLLTQGDGERNYHIFYELLAAADSSDREMYFLDEYTAEDFNLINQSGIYDRRDEVNDLEQFESLGVSMAKMGFSEEVQTQINAVICALLHASNVTFTAISDDESEVDFQNLHLKSALTLLGLDSNAFSDTMCFYYIQIGKERHKRNQPKRTAEKGLEAFMKAVYGALFDYLVAEINQFIQQSRNNKKIASYIGVLDIFGFESFATNSFEQLCINYCNESLQQQFNMQVFKEEQEIYKKEGINWSFIEFPDNVDVLELIDKRGTGIIPILDDICKAPNPKDTAFASRLYQVCKTNPRFEADFRQVGAGLFGIKHYIGPVEYNTSGFIEKNKDEIPRETMELLNSSTNSFVITLVKFHEKSIWKTSQNSSASNRNQKSVGGQFKLQLQSLREKIEKTQPHYIRCLKPNSLLEAGIFDSKMISDQLRSAGVLEAIRVSRIGYPQRYTHVNFLQRYSILDTKVTMSKKFQKMNSKQKCESLIQSLVVNILEKHDSSERDIQMGKTKVFLRQNSFDEIECSLVEILSKSAVLIQKNVRAFTARSIFLKQVQATICIQSHGRKMLAIMYVESVRRIHATTIIQKYWRCYKARSILKNKLFIASWCQRFHRGKSIRNKYPLTSYREATIKIQCFVRIHFLETEYVPQEPDPIDFKNYQLKEECKERNETKVNYEDEVNEKEIMIVALQEENKDILCNYKNEVNEKEIMIVALQEENKDIKCNYKNEVNEKEVIILALQEENINLQSKNDQIEKELKELKEKYEEEMNAKETTVLDILENNKDLHFKNVELQKNLDECKIKFDEDVSNRDKVIGELKEENKYLLFSSSEVVPKLNDIKETITNDMVGKDQKILDLQNEKKEIYAKAQELEQKLSTLTEKYDSEIVSKDKIISKQEEEYRQLQENSLKLADRLDEIKESIDNEIVSKIVKSGDQDDENKLLLSSSLEVMQNLQDIKHIIDTDVTAKDRKINDLQEEIDLLKSNIMQNEKNIYEMSEKHTLEISSKEKELNDSKKEVTKLQSNSRALEQQLSELQGKFDVEIKSKDEKIDGLQEENKSFEFRSLQLTENLDCIKNMIDINIDTKTKKLEELQEENKCLSASAIELTQEIKETKRKYEDELLTRDGKMNDLEIQNEETHAKAQELEQKLSTLTEKYESEIVSKDKIINKQEEEYRQLQENSLKLADRLDEIKESIDNEIVSNGKRANDQDDENKLLLSSSLEVMQNLQDIKQTIDTDVTAKDRKINDLQEEIDLLKSNIMQNEKNIYEMSEKHTLEISSKEKELNDLKEEVNKSQSNSRALEQQLSELQGKFDVEIKSKDEEMIRLKDENETHQINALRLTENLDSIKNMIDVDIENKTKKLDELQEENKCLSASATELSQEINDTKRKYEDELLTRDEKVNDLETEKKEIHAKAQELEDKLRTLNEKYESDISAMDKKISEQQEKIKHLECSSLENEDKIKALNTQYEGDLSSKDLKIKELADENKLLLANSVQFEQEQKEFQQKLSSGVSTKGEENKKLKEENSRLMNELQDLNDSLKQVTTSAEELESMKLELKQSHHDKDILQKKYEAEKEALFSLKEELIKVKESHLKEMSSSLQNSSHNPNDEVLLEIQKELRQLKRSAANGNNGSFMNRYFCGKK